MPKNIIFCCRRLLHLLLASSLVLFSTLAPAQEDLLIPDGFIAQVLEPTYGRIFRPHDWFYVGSATESGWRWIISQQDPKKGYETGQRIDLLMHVEENTQMSNRDFAYNFLQKKQRHATVLAECPEIYLGKFVRKCLEVLEDAPNSGGRRRLHALYTVYWGFTLDMVVVSSFVTPEQNWKNVRKIADTMSHFEPVGKKPD